MKEFIKIVILDSLQRIRCYQYFMTLVVTLYVASTFVPAPDASYSTVNLGNFRPLYNSAWVGTSTAMMTALFMVIIGFFLVEGTIERDAKLNIHTFIKTSAFGKKYLQMKGLSNVILLSLISLVIFCMTMVMFPIRGEEGSFVFLDFVLPFVLITFPTVVFVGYYSVIIEVVLSGSRVLKVIAMIVSWSLLIPAATIANPSSNGYLLDAVGISLPIAHVKATILNEFNFQLDGMSFGYQFFDRSEQQLFELSSLEYPQAFLWSRLFFILTVVTLVYVISLFIKNPWKKIKMNPVQAKKIDDETIERRSSSKLTLPSKIKYGNSFIPLIVQEITLMKKNISSFQKFIISALWTSTLLVPIDIAHLFLIPGVYVIYSKSIGELGGRSFSNNVSAYSLAYPKVFLRQNLSHYFSVIAIMIAMALPTLVRLIMSGDLSAISRLTIGIVFIASLSNALGSLTKSGRLFEILFIFTTYLLLNKLPIADYLGAIHENGWENMSYLLLLTCPVLLLISWFRMKIYSD